MPKVVVIANANGAGKSTLAPSLLRDTLGIYEYVNADTLAQGLSAFAPERAAFDAGRIMLKRLNELAAARQDFAFETTLASRFYARWLKKLQAHGYSFSLIFLWLQTEELAIERVKAHVQSGGHNVAEEVIRRRYVNGLRNFFELYCPFADSWQVYESSSTLPNIIAFGKGTMSAEIMEQELWKRMLVKAQ